MRAVKWVRGRGALRRAAALCLAALLLTPLAACARHRGDIAEYDGFTVKTERARGQEQETTGRALPAEDAEIEDYVINKGSGKFHYPSCSAVSEISEKNRWDYRGTRGSVTDMGYQPCKICSP